MVNIILYYLVVNTVLLILPLRLGVRLTLIIVVNLTSLMLGLELMRVFNNLSNNYYNFLIRERGEILMFLGFRINLERLMFIGILIKTGSNISLFGKIIVLDSRNILEWMLWSNIRTYNVILILLWSNRERTLLLLIVLYNIRYIIRTGYGLVLLSVIRRLSRLRFIVVLTCLDLLRTVVIIISYTVTLYLIISETNPISFLNLRRYPFTVFFIIKLIFIRTSFRLYTIVIFLLLRLQSINLFETLRFSSIKSRERIILFIFWRLSLILIL